MAKTNMAITSVVSPSLNLPPIAISRSIRWDLANTGIKTSLEKIADTAAGTLAYIAEAAQAVTEFGRLFNRMQSVGLTNAYLQIELKPKVRLAELKPVAQVAPDTIELAVEDEW